MCFICVQIDMYVSEYRRWMERPKHIIMWDERSSNNIEMNLKFLSLSNSEVLKLYVFLGWNSYKYDSVVFTSYKNLSQKLT